MLPELAQRWAPAAAQGQVTAMQRFGARTGRQYHPFEYAGDPDAERVMIIMGSGAETARATADALRAKGEKLGVVQVRLYRPFSVKHLLEVLPQSVHSIVVLDRTKEPGSIGEPLYLDVVAALASAVSDGVRHTMPRVIGQCRPSHHSAARHSSAAAFCLPIAARTYSLMPDFATVLTRSP